MSNQLDYQEATLAHVAEVQRSIGLVCQRLRDRAQHHDDSKFEEPESSVFAKVTPQLRGLTYGSDEYRAQLKKLGPALEHHYANNSHHPEHYDSGIAGMDLLDLVEMFCDWVAATKRHDDGDLEKSIEINEKRFGIDPQLVSIFKNTVARNDW